MCGIFAFLGYDFDIDKLYQNLLILQNRGYDSAGLCSITSDYKFLVHKFASTKSETAFDLLKPYISEYGKVNNFISHVRYSCVGVPSDNNSHPHFDYTNKFSLVHNGIIENYSSLKKELISNGVNFSSETDTEVIVNLIGYYYSLLETQNDNEGDNVRIAIEKALDRLEGTWGLVIQCLDTPDKLFCVRHGSPLLVGLNENYAMISSEQSGFCNYVKNYISLNNHDIVELTRENGTIVMSSIKNYELLSVKAQKFCLSPDPYEHWTLKEIHEQFQSSIRAMGMGSRLKDDKHVKLGGLDVSSQDIIDIDNLILLGCGTSYNAGLYSSYFFKKISGFNTVQIFDGAEFTRYDVPKKGKTGLIMLSQSGETKDLHRCIDIGKELGLVMIGVINVVDSAIARDVHCGVYLNSGKEVGVASTKCFTSQIIALSMIACWFSQNRNINEVDRMEIIKSLRSLPYDISKTIKSSTDDCIKVAQYLSNYNGAFLLGKGQNKAIALEGALKIKELGYLNTNGYSTSSLKHGSYALISDGYPTILLLPDDSMYRRNNSVGEELKSRKSFVICITDREDDTYLNNTYDLNIYVSKNKMFFGVISNICLQLIAYHVAVIRGNRVDTPRNLCKSVTVD